MSKGIQRSRHFALKKRPLSRISTDGGEEPLYDNYASNICIANTPSKTLQPCNVQRAAHNFPQKRKSSNFDSKCQPLYDNRVETSSQTQAGWCRLSGLYGKTNPRRATTAADATDDEAIYEDIAATAWLKTGETSEPKAQYAGNLSKIGNIDGSDGALVPNALLKNAKRFSTKNDKGYGAITNDDILSTYDNVESWMLATLDLPCMASASHTHSSATSDVSISSSIQPAFYSPMLPSTTLEVTEAIHYLQEQDDQSGLCLESIYTQIDGDEPEVTDNDSDSGPLYRPIYALPKEFSSHISRKYNDDNGQKTAVATTQPTAGKIKLTPPRIPKRFEIAESPRFSPRSKTDGQDTKVFRPTQLVVSQTESSW